MPPPLRPLMEDADTFFYTVWLLGRFSSVAQSFVLFLCGKVFFTTNPSCARALVARLDRILD